MSWYEWGLYLLRLQKQSDKDKFQWEEEWERTRILWAATINGYPPKRAVSPKDLIWLDRDGAKTDLGLTPERRKEIEAFAKRRFGAKLKKRGKQ